MGVPFFFTRKIEVEPPDNSIQYLSDRLLKAEREARMWRTIAERVRSEALSIVGRYDPLEAQKFYDSINKLLNQYD